MLPGIDPRPLASGWVFVMNIAGSSGEQETREQSFDTQAFALRLLCVVACVDECTNKDGEICSEWFVQWEAMGHDDGP